MSKSIFRQSLDRVFVKICGVTNLADAQWCARAGADAIGILLQKDGDPPGPESVRLGHEQAVRLVAALPQHLRSVVLAHTDDPRTIVQFCSDIRPDAVQLQEAVDLSGLEAIRRSHPDIALIKTVFMRQETETEALVEDLRSLAKAELINAVLLDSPRGGSGATHDWDRAASMRQALDGMPVILAGGLTSANVGAALQRVSPWGTDVMTGVASSSRKAKDPRRVQDFIQAARQNRKESE